MSSIKQQIPSFIQGMSDQPDELKKPGQVRSLINAIPDVALGLQKRPGIEYLNTLEGSDEDGKWLNIFAENSFADALLQRGIYVIGFFFPVVPKGQARIRVQLSAAHSSEHIDRAITAFTEVGRELGVI